MNLFAKTPEAQQRRRILAALAVLLIIVAGAIGYFFYNQWRLRDLLADARASMSTGDFPTASLKIRRVLQLAPEHLQASGLMADVCEKAGDRDAISWRQRVVQLSGSSADSLLALARTAIGLDRPSVAAQALQRVPAEHRSRADFHALSGAVALQTGNHSEAARCYELAAKAEPDRVSHRFALGRAQMASDDYITRENGRTLLQSLERDPEYGIQALRLLVETHESAGEPHAALRHSAKLQSLPAHRFTDELSHLRLLKAVADPSFDDALAAAQTKARSDSRSAGALLVWMAREGLADDALTWATQRDPDVQKLDGIEPGLAACFAALADWPALLKLTEKSSWQIEFSRHAYRARALREQHDPSFAHVEWSRALATAGREAEALMWLARMSLEWKWRDEAEQVLWTILDQLPGTTWAVELLKGHYVANGNTRGLRRIAEHLLHVNPENQDALNDLALLSLLLGADEEKAFEMCRQLHEKQRQNSAYASTYAFALHRAGRSAEALKLFQEMPESQRMVPAYAAYYGVILAAVEGREKALPFLEIGKRASLLPEERELVENALKIAAAAPPE